MSDTKQFLIYFIGLIGVVALVTLTIMLLARNMPEPLTQRHEFVDQDKDSPTYLETIVIQVPAREKYSHSLFVRVMAGLALLVVLAVAAWELSHFGEIWAWIGDVLS